MKKVLSIVLCVIVCCTLCACGAEKIVWSEMILGEILPEPPANKGEIHYNSAEELWVDVNNISDKQYANYVDACKEKGFTTDIKTDSYSYSAYNKDGYKLSISHYRNDGDMKIQIEKPMEMTTITWPTSTAGKQLPTPKSTIGKFSHEYDDNFFLYVGNTSRADYMEYVNACSKKGFTVDYNKGDDYYYADNSKGWHIALRYEGNNIMSIDIDAPSKDNSGSDISNSSSNNKADDGELDSDFKAAMDSYEKFMDEYVAFMKKYKSNPSDLSLLSDYSDYMNKYADFVKDFEKWENEEMNAAETAYYIDVQARVSKKLLEAAQ